MEYVKLVGLKVELYGHFIFDYLWSMGSGVVLYETSFFCETRLVHFVPKKKKKIRLGFECQVT